MFPDLLMVATRTDADFGALAVATALAERTSAHLAVLVAVETALPMVTEWGGFPTTLYAQLRDQALADGTRHLERLREALGSHAAELRLLDVLAARAGIAAASHAHHADLVIMAAPRAARGGAYVAGMFADLLVGCGRPVLLVPEGWQGSLPPQRVSCAWKASKEAARAIHDALPVLRAAESVDVVVVDPARSDPGEGDRPGAELARHLARHGVRAELHGIPRTGGTVGDALIQHARESGADLIVAGGFSHSRLREQVLGGVTRDLEERSPIPVLFSH